MQFIMINCYIRTVASAYKEENERKKNCVHFLPELNELPIVLSKVPLYKRESWSCDRSHDENQYRINYQFYGESQCKRSLKNISSQNSIKMIVLFFVLPLILLNSGKCAGRKIKRERKSIRISMRQICYMSTLWFS